MMTSLRNSPPSRQARSSVVTVMRPLEGGAGYWINLRVIHRRVRSCRQKWTNKQGFLNFCVLVLPGGKMLQTRSARAQLPVSHPIRFLLKDTD